jgi:hypothetical protein
VLAWDVVWNCLIINSDLIDCQHWISNLIYATIGRYLLLSKTENWLWCVWKWKLHFKIRINKFHLIASWYGSEIAFICSNIVHRSRFLRDDYKRNIFLQHWCKVFRRVLFIELCERIFFRNIQVMKTLMDWR